jgi:3-isopropylmalate dehydrogenase
MKLKITVLPGDGIGPEVTREAVSVLRAVADLYAHQIDFVEHPIGGVAIRDHGAPLPPATLAACLDSDAVLLGAVGSPEFDALPASARPEAGLLLLRRSLGGYANLRPAISYDAIASASPLRPEIALGADILIVRELLGGLYFGEPRSLTEADGQSVAVNTMRYSTAEVERVARVAFEAARQRQHKVTSVDKANVLETSQLWRRTVSLVARDYPDVTLDHLYVDACAMHLIMNPKRFDVIVTENLFGDILSDEAAVITGSLGMLGSATIGGKVGLYEPVHGSAPDIAGQGIANPFGAIASAAMLLRYAAKLDREAEAIEDAIRAVLKAGHRTRDIKSEAEGQLATTSEIGKLVREAIAERAALRSSPLSVVRGQ